MSEPLIGIDASRVAVAGRTGTEQYTWELLAGLARIERLTPFRLYTNGLPVALPPLGPNFSLRAISLPRLWTHARLGPDVLRDPPDCLFVPAHVLPLGISLRARLRSVVTVHDLGYLHVPQAHTRTQRLYLELSTRYAARSATRLIAISQATADDLIRHYAARPERISVVHHGIAARFVPASTTEIAALRARHQLPPRFILAVGTIQPRKNYLRLLGAFAELARSQPDLQLVIAGKRGWLSEAIARRIGELGERVRLLGYIDDAELPAFYSAAELLALPSLYEGFGMPVLEAMACGCVVLCSNSSALPEVAGDAALLVDPLDQQSIRHGLARLLEDAQLRDQLRQRGFARAAGFSWDRCAHATLQVLR